MQKQDDLEESKTPPPVDTKKFVCKTCGKGFRLLHYLESHMRTHTQEKRYECCYCAKKFNSWPNMHRHKRIHTGERPYKCDICSKTFNQPAVYNEHVKKHTGEKPFKCPHCPMSFPRNSRLDSHIRVHTGERPFVCKICYKTFSQPHHLVTHTRSHTNERPYFCSLCNMGFTSSSNLIRHFKRMHEGVVPPTLPIVSLPTPEDGCTVQLSEGLQELEELNIKTNRVQVRGTVQLTTPGGAKRIRSFFPEQQFINGDPTEFMHFTAPSHGRSNMKNFNPPKPMQIVVDLNCTSNNNSNNNGIDEIVELKECLVEEPAGMMPQEVVEIVTTSASDMPQQQQQYYTLVNMSKQPIYQMVSMDENAANEAATQQHHPMYLQQFVQIIQPSQVMPATAMAWGADVGAATTVPGSESTGPAQMFTIQGPGLIPTQTLQAYNPATTMLELPTTVTTTTTTTSTTRISLKVPIMRMKKETEAFL